MHCKLNMYKTTGLNSTNLLILFINVIIYSKLALYKLSISVDIDTGH